MSAVAVESPVNVTLDAVPQQPGIVRVRERVIDKVVREASAIAIGVSRDNVSDAVAEWGRGLAGRIAARRPVPRPQDIPATSGGLPIH